MVKLLNKMKNMAEGLKCRLSYCSSKWRLSEKAAKKMQKTAYDDMKSILDEMQFTPPYKEIAKQLDASNEQLFSAALYHLTRIALNRADYKPEILSIIHQKLADAKIEESARKKLEQALGELK